MPFNEIKIDKSFVMDIPKSEEARVIVRVITDLGRSLGLTVCAEGVESREALDYVRSVGCSSAQGYHMSRPIPAADLTNLLESWRN